MKLFAAIASLALLTQPVLAMGTRPAKWTQVMESNDNDVWFVDSSSLGSRGSGISSVMTRFESPDGTSKESWFHVDCRTWVYDANHDKTRAFDWSEIKDNTIAFGLAKYVCFGK